MQSIRRTTLLVCCVLALAACGTPASSATSAVSPSGAAAESTTPAPSATPSPTPSPTPQVAARCDKVAKPFDAKKVDLTGRWAGDDLGIYYLRQVGSVLWWNGMSGRDGPPASLGREWNNVARGEISGLTVDAEWADVPRGEILGSGTLNLKVEDDGTGNIRIVKVSETGTGFGNSIWTPCAPG
jgi:hypothetical protein